MNRLNFHKGWAGVLLWSTLITGCQSIHPPSAPILLEPEPDTLEAKVLSAVRSYYPNADLRSFRSKEISEWLNQVAPGSRIQKSAPSSLGFIRGLEPELSVSPAEWLSPTTLYFKISFWGRRTVMEATRQISSGKERLEQPGGGLIIDLRGNQGGQLDTALEMVNAFLPTGETVVTIRPIRGEDVAYRTSSSDPYRFPVVLLVDRRTASSAELFAGILQQQKRAFLIGTPTTGKDTIQSAIPLDHEHLLLLTTGYFELPEHPRMSGVGLSPDEIVQEKDDAKDRALTFLQRGQPSISEDLMENAQHLPES